MIHWPLGRGPIWTPRHSLIALMVIVSIATAMEGQVAATQSANTSTARVVAMHSEARQETVDDSGRRRVFRIKADLNLDLPDVSMMNLMEEPITGQTVIVEGRRFFRAGTLPWTAAELQDGDRQALAPLIELLTDSQAPNWSAVLQPYTAEIGTTESIGQDIIDGVAVEYRRFPVKENAALALQTLLNPTATVAAGLTRSAASTTGGDGILKGATAELWTGVSNGFPYRFVLRSRTESYELELEVQHFPLYERVPITAPQ